MTHASRVRAHRETSQPSSDARMRSSPCCRTHIVAALMVAAAASAGCYSYVPVSLGTIAPKEDVRVRVTDAAATRLADQLGSFSTEIDGQLSPEGSDSVLVGVSIDRTYRGATIGTTTQVLSLGRSEVVDVRRREFSRSRTILVSAGTVVGFGLLAAGITQLVDPNGPSQDQPPPPPPAPVRRPLGYRLGLRIPIP
jgi:hypothetical protein